MFRSRDGDDVLKFGIQIFAALAQVVRPVDDVEEQEHEGEEESGKVVHLLRAHVFVPGQFGQVDGRPSVAVVIVLRHLAHSHVLHLLHLRVGVRPCVVQRVGTGTS